MSRAGLYCLLANVLGGATFVAMDGAGRSGLPECTFTFLRTLLSLLLFVLLFVSLALRTSARGTVRPRFSAREWGLVLLVAGPGFALPLVLGIRGVKQSTAGLGSILALLEPIGIIPLCFLFLGERVPGRRLLGMALGLAGAALVILSGRLAGGDPGRDHLAGNVILAIQAFCWSVYTVAAKPLVARHSALTISTWTTAVGCLLSGLFALLEWPQLWPGSLGEDEGAIARAAGAIGLQHGLPPGVTLRAALVAAAPWGLFLAVFGSFLSVFLWNAGLKGVDASKMAIFIFVQPAVGLLLNAAMGAEAPTRFAWFGLLLILGAVALVSREPRGRAAAADAGPSAT